MIEAGSNAFWRATIALCLGAVAIFANLNISQPLMPVLSTEFALTPLQASWSLSLPYVTLGLSLLAYGPLSDALGRRWLMILSLVGTVTLSGLVALAESYGTLLWLRAFQGVFLAGLPAIAIAYMGEEFNRSAMQVAVGFYICFNTIGGISGRLIGGALTQVYSWQSSFFTLAVISAVLTLAFAWMLPASTRFQPQPLRPKVITSNWLCHLRNPLLLGAFFIGGLNFLMFCNLYTFIAYRLSAAPFALPTALLGLLFLTYLTGSAGSAVSGKISHRFGPIQCMLTGILVAAFGVGITLFDDLLLIVLGLLICSMGFFFCHSITSAWVNRYAERAPATASSLYLLFYYLGGAGGSFYFSPLWEHGGWLGVVLGAWIILLVTTGIALWLKRRITVVMSTMDQPATHQCPLPTKV